MEITLHGTLEEIDAFVLRWQTPRKDVTDIKSKATQIEINGHKMALDSVPESLQAAIKKQTASPESPPSLENIFTIPKFKWDKNLEKSYRNMFFYEADDGRVMLSYFSSKVFTTKDKVLQIPFPLVLGFEPLRKFNPNQRSALRFYRQYLAERDSAPKYIEKTTQDRIKENFEKKEKAKEIAKEMSPKTKELHDNIAMKIMYGNG